MRKLNLKGKEVQFYDSIHDLPIRRFQKFNKHMMIACEVGESVADYDKRMQRANGYLRAKDIDGAINEITNQRQCLYNILEEYSPSGLALCTLVYSIDGKVYSVVTDEDLQEIQNTLDSLGFSKEMLDTTISEVKKN